MVPVKVTQFDTAVDYKKEVAEVKKGDKLKINPASGGGWVAKKY